MIINLLYPIKLNANLKIKSAKNKWSVYDKQSD